MENQNINNLSENKENQNSENFTCPYCGKTFTTHRGLMRHIHSVHVNEAKENEEKTEEKKEEKEEISTGIEEEEIDYSKTNEIKEKLLEMAEEKEESKEEYEKENEGESEEILSEISFEPEDFGEIYLSIFSIIAQLMGIDLYNDPIFLKRIEKRGLVLQKLFFKYGISEDTTAIIMLVSGVITDFMYLLSKRKEKKQKELEEKEKGGNNL